MTLDEAESAIAEILRKLEIDTQSLVDSISINDIEITQLDSDRKQFQRRVEIELRRNPGSNW